MPRSPRTFAQRRIQLQGSAQGLEAYGNTHDLELASLREQSGMFESHMLSIDGPIHLVHILSGGLTISSPTIDITGAGLRSKVRLQVSR